MSASPTVGGKGTASETLAARIVAARRRAFVGRVGELDLFRDALSEDPPPFALLFLHGPGGIGKSALLRRLADEAEACGRLAVTIDCRVAGTPATLLPALSAALDLPADVDPLPALQARPAIVLLLDTYEAAPGLDHWLREVLLPQLPERGLVVVAGREPPSHGWRDDPAWHDLLRVVSLRNLAPDDAHALLAARGVAPPLHEAILALAGGYPLALALHADLVAQTGVAPVRHEQAPDVVAALLERFVSEAPSPLHRRALQVCAHARHTTEAMLAAVLPEADAALLFDWLRRLSFIEQTPDGLMPHDLAREVLDTDLRWRDEAGYVELHTRIRDHAVARLRATRGAEQERVMREVQYLHHHNPVFRPFMTWEGTGAVTARPLDETDVEPITAMAEAFEDPTSAGIVAFWARRQPEAFMIFERPGDAVISGFATFLDLAEPAPDEVRTDPVVAAAFGCLRARAPLRPADRVFIGRHFVFRHAYGRPCPEFDLVQLRSALHWLNEPDLAWSFIAVPAMFAPFWGAEMNYIDMPRVVEADVQVGERAWVLFGRDWRASPADVWLKLMADRELAFDLDPERLPGEPAPTLVVLSQQEFADAVRAALREATRPERLVTNPLARSRLVQDRGQPVDLGQALAEILVDAVDGLRGDGQGDKLHRAVATTFFKGAPTQEAAAERLGLPFSTYRRHLVTGIERVTERLWEHELHGGGWSAGWVVPPMRRA